ncbi:MAG: EVE domain-containing protein [Verrucomicrobiota bacterium]
MKGKNFWLVKQEPDSYSWDNFVQDKETAWTGVRNFQARNNLRAMKKGDLVFYYHSNIGKEIVGIAKVSKEHYPDKTAEEGDWSAVDLTPLKPLKTPVTLDQIKTEPALKEMALVRNSRLSVQPVTPGQAARVLELAATKI